MGNFIELIKILKLVVYYLPLFTKMEEKNGTKMELNYFQKIKIFLL
jgi:hypothetical protein